jgi:hypothetical protein
MLALATLGARAQSQVTLGTSPYTQNFDGMGNGSATTNALPAGFSVYTGATAASIGSAPTAAQLILKPGDATTAWNTTSGAFKNFASGNSLASVANATAQTGAADRALGVRQTGSFGDGAGVGPAFVFRIDNTTGKTDFVLNFKLQSLDATSGRVTTWRVDYGLGATPTSFTQVPDLTVNTQATSTATTGASTFANTTITANFKGELDNEPGPIWIRIVAPTATATTGSTNTNRPSSAIDDFVLSWQSNPTAPALAVSPRSLNFGKQNINTTSTAQTFVLNGYNLPNDATVTTAAPFSVSKDGTTYATSVTYSAAELAAGAKTVSVRYTPTTRAVDSGPQSGTVVVSSPGANSRTVTVTGSGTDPSQTVYDFNACASATALGDGWTQFSVTGAQTWGCNARGRDPKDLASTTGLPYAVNMNGYSNGNQPNEDWLISPALNLTNYQYPLFQFWNLQPFAGPSLKLRVSTNYTGTGNPNAATWTDLNVPFNANSNQWTQSIPVNLAAYKQAGVYVAFVYTSTTAGAASWSIDDVTLTNSATPPAPRLTLSPGFASFGYQAVGSTSDQSFTVSASDLTSNLTVTSPNAAFTLSTDGTTFGPAVTLTQADVNSPNSKAVTVRFSPTAAATAYTGPLALAATGYTGTVPVSGNTYDVARTLEVVNWNIEWFGSTAQAPTDDDLQQKNATTVLTGLGADVYALAEIVDTVRLRNVVAQLSTNLGIPYGYKIGTFGTGADTTSSGNYASDQKLAFIYRKDIVKPVLFTAPLKYTSQAAQAYAAWSSGRFPYQMTADVTLNGLTQRINFVVIHAKANENSSVTASADAYSRRKTGADLLKSFLDNRYPGGNTLIVGDYNDVLNGTIALGVSPAVSSYSSFLQDANYVPLTLELANAGAQSTADYPTVIDNVIASKPMASYYIDGSTAIRTDITDLITGYGNNTSDHYPVYSRYYFAAPDLVVNTPSQMIAGGTYNNVTVTNMGSGILQGPLVVNGAFTVSGGLTTNCQPITGNGTFTVADGALLSICDANGIAATGSTGAVQVTGTRSFSPAANYQYNGTAAQITGSGLPSQVRELASTNANSLTLSQPLAVARTLYVLGKGNVVLNGQALTLLSSASGTAVVVNSGTGVVTGTATVQRYLDGSLNAGLGYRQLSSPVSNSTVADLATASFSPVVNPSYNTSATPGTTRPYPTVYSYDESRLSTTTNNLQAFDKGWLSPASLTDALTVGKGYTVNLAANQVVDFVGTLNNGDLTQSLTRQNQSIDGGWQLVGNPYPSPIDWRQVAASDRSGLDGAMYVSQSTGQYAGTYRSYTNGVGGFNSIIPLGQGFFVRISAGISNAALTLRNTHRLDYTTQVEVQRTAAETRPLLHLTLATPSGNLDGLYVYAEAGATPSFDAQQDAAKLPNTNGLNLAALTPSGEPLSIQGLAALSGRVALRVQAPAAGTYTLAAAELLNLPAGTTVVLEDAQTGQRTPLAATGAAYSFTVAAGDKVDGRFWLNLTAASPLATLPGALQTALTLYPNPSHDGQATLLVPAGLGAGQVQVLDALGRLVRQQPLAAGGRTTLQLAGLPAGVYVVRVQTNGEQATRRLTLN